MFEVKPWEAGADLKGLFDKIRQTEIDGLVWGEAHKLVPVAFGVKKLVLSCVVVDSKVGENMAGMVLTAPRADPGEAVGVYPIAFFYCLVCVLSVRETQNETHSAHYQSRGF